MNCGRFLAPRKLDWVMAPMRLPPAMSSRKQVSVAPCLWRVAAKVAHVVFPVRCENEVQEQLTQRDSNRCSLGLSSLSCSLS